MDGQGFYEQYKRKRKLAEYGIDPIIMGNDTIKRVDMVRQKWLDNNFYGFTTSFAVKTDDFSTTLGGVGIGMTTTTLEMSSGQV